MVVALSSLRVGAEIDAGKYTAGMAEKVAADKAGAASSVAVGEALTATNTKISQSGDVLTRLRRQYVDGAANAQRFEAAITTLGRGIERGAVPLSEVSSILDGIYKKYQLTADAALLMERGQVDLAKAVETANAKLKQQNSIVPANQNTHPANNFQATNVAYQLQDVFSTAALGSSPFTVALQQGPQLASVFGETGAAGAVKTLGAAFTSLLSPVSLITIGLTGATAAAIQYFTSSNDGVKNADKVLTEHAALIREIRDAYGDAAAGLDDYTKKTNIQLGEFANANLLSLKKVAKSAGQDFFDELGQLGSARTGGFVVDAQFAPFRSAIDNLRQGVKAGKPDFDAFYQQINKIVATNPGKLTDLGGKVVELSQAFLDAQKNVDQANAAIGVIGGTAAAQIDRVHQLSQELQALAGIAMAPVTATDQIAANVNAGLSKLNEYRNGGLIDEEARRRLLIAGSLADQRIDAGFVDMGDGRRVSAPTPDARPNIELEGLPGADKLAKSAQKSADAYRDVIKNARDRIDQMKLEATTSGETGIAADTLSFKLKLLQDATDKGRTVTAGQRAEIEKLADAYRSAAIAASEAKLQQDIQFQQRQLGRSSMDQNVASTLRQYGLPEDLNSYDAQLIRSNEQLKQSRDLAGDFASTLANGLRQGEGLWKSFGDAATSVLSKISDMLLNDVLNSLFRVNSAASSSGGGGFLSGLLGLFGGGSSSGFDLGAGATAFTGTQPFANGGIFSNSIVTRPTLFPFAKGTGLMGEAGPEAIMPLRRDASGRLGVSSPSNDNRSSSSSGTSGVHVSLGVAFDQDEGFRAYVKDVARTEGNAAAKAGIKDYDQQMPDRVAQINLHPRRR
ncbi:phage tail length tape measure family protein [Rhizobium sp. LEGMi198b]